MKGKLEQGRLCFGHWGREREEGGQGHGIPNPKRPRAKSMRRVSEVTFMSLHFQELHAVVIEGVTTDLLAYHDLHRLKASVHGGLFKSQLKALFYHSGILRSKYALRTPLVHPETQIALFSGRPSLDLTRGPRGHRPRPSSSSSSPPAS